MRTTWNGVPKDLRDAAAPLLETYRRLLPGWVKLFSVRYDDEMADAVACVVSEQNYNRASLTFGAGWLNCDAVEREWTVVHELAHTQLAPIERALESLMVALPKRTRQIAEKLYEDALEESVSGLAYALVKEGGE